MKGVFSGSTGFILLTSLNFSFYTMKHSNKCQLNRVYDYSIQVIMSCLKSYIYYLVLGLLKNDAIIIKFNITKIKIEVIKRGFLKSCFVSMVLEREQALIAGLARVGLLMQPLIYALFLG